MSHVIVVAVVVAVVAVGVLVIGVRLVVRRRRLRQRFGPEYDRLIGESDSKREAEAELAGRERRVRDLDIRPLSDSARDGYAEQWAAVQEQFVATPAEAAAASQALVVAVMRERGYLAADHDQVLADLSVEFGRTLDRYRAAEEISERAASGAASTEDLRLAMIDYLALFRELLGEPSDALPGSAQADPERVIEADRAAPGNDDARLAGMRRPMTPVDPVPGGREISSAEQTPTSRSDLTKKG